MAEVQAFRGLRYVPQRVGPLGRVVCPPYDVISDREAAALRQASPYNAIHIELPEPEPGDSTGASRYARAAALLRQWQAEGALARDERPHLYAVEERFTWEGVTHCRRGVLAAVRLADWSEHVVLPHERTLAAPKADRLELLRACATNISPVFLLHPSQPEAQAALWHAVEQRPPLTVVELGAAREERVWALGADAGDWQAMLAVGPLYIADGHHRYETALRYRDERRAGRASAPRAGWEYVLAYLVAMDDPGLLVLPTHRCLPPTLPVPGRLDALLSERFEVVARQPRAGGTGAVLKALAEWGATRTTFALYRGGEFTLLRPRAEAARWLPADRAAAWRALDVAQLEALLLQPLLGPDAAEALTYTRDAEEAVAAVDAGIAAAAVLVNPPRPEQIAAVADAGERMPQKSTYFYPKLSTGLVFHVLDDRALD